MRRAGLFSSVTSPASASYACCRRCRSTAIAKAARRQVLGADSRSKPAVVDMHSEEARDIWQRTLLVNRQLRTAVKEEQYELAQTLSNQAQGLQASLPDELRQSVSYVVGLWSGTCQEQVEALKPLWDMVDLQGMPDYLRSTLKDGTWELLITADANRTLLRASSKELNGKVDRFNQWLWTSCPVRDTELQTLVSDVKLQHPPVGMVMEKLMLLRSYVSMANQEARIVGLEATKLAVEADRSQLRGVVERWDTFKNAIIAVSLLVAVATPLCLDDETEPLPLMLSLEAGLGSVFVIGYCSFCRYLTQVESKYKV